MGAGNDWVNQLYSRRCLDICCTDYNLVSSIARVEVDLWPSGSFFRNLPANYHICNTGICKKTIGDANLLRVLSGSFMSVPQDKAPPSPSDKPRWKLKVPDPLTCLKLFLFRHLASEILINSIFYMAYCCLQVPLSSLFIEIHEFRRLQAGLVYTPFAVGCVLTSYLSGLSCYRLLHTHLLILPFYRAADEP